MHYRRLLPCLFLSGSTALIYELIWVRLLSLSFGSTLLSFSTVLAVFFGGLALGATVGGRYARRLAQPMRWYGGLELGIATCAPLVHLALSALPDAFAVLDPGPGAGGAAIRFLVAAPILLVPTVLMGATLPVFVQGAITENRHTTAGLGLLYGLNTLGACTGVYAFTYHLLPALGLWRASLCAALVNALIGVAAGAAARSQSPEGAETAPKAQDAADSTPAGTGTSTLIAFLLGFAAVGLQIVWARVFGIVLEGTIYGVSAVLISVLLGIAAGSLFVGTALRRTRAPAGWLAWMQIFGLLGVVGMAALFPPLTYVLRVAMGRPSLAALHESLGWVLLATVVPTFCSGASLPLLTRAVEGRARRAAAALARVYASNTAGSIAASLSVGFVILPGAGTEATLYFMLLFLVVACLLSLRLPSARPRRTRMGRAWAPLTSAAAILIGFLLFPGLDTRHLSVTTPVRGAYPLVKAERKAQVEALEYFSEGHEATVAVLSSPDPKSGGTLRSLAVNGLGQGSRTSAPPHYVFESLLLSWIPALHAPSMARTLVVGLGSGVTADTLDQLGADHIDVVELEPRVAQAVDIIYEGKSPLERANIDLHVNDARHHLLLNAKKGAPYDLITSMPSHPWIASSIFTEDFFQLARRNLSDKGVFCTWFGLGKANRAVTKSLLSAFARSFPYHVVYWVPEAVAFYAVGGTAPFPITMARLNRLAAHPLARHFPALQHPTQLLGAVYGSGTPGSPTPAARPHTDDNAIVQLYAAFAASGPPVPPDGLPQRYLAPAFLAADDRDEIFHRILEGFFGTPDGDLTDARTPPRPGRAQRWLAGIGAALTPEAQQYYRGRIELLRGEPEGHQSLLRLAAATPGDVWSERAYRHLWGRRLRNRATDTPPPALDIPRFATSPGTWAALAERFPETAAAHLASGPRPGPDDPVRYWIWHGTRGEPARDGAEFWRSFSTNAEALRSVPRPAILRFARRAIERLAPACPDARLLQGARALWTTAAKRRAERDLAGSLAQAQAAARAQRPDRALQILDEVLAGDPLNRRALEAVVQVAPQAGEDEAGQAARTLLTILGVDPAAAPTPAAPSPVHAERIAQ